MYRQFLTQDNKEASDFNFFFFPAKFKKYVFIYFWPCWVFVTAQTFLWLWRAGVRRGSSPVAGHGLLVAAAALVVREL